jgi:hypothetical protein
MTPQSSFNADGALKTAHGFHAAAGQLEVFKSQLFTSIRRGEGVRAEPRPPGIVGVPLEPETLTQLMGVGAGAVVLEALAVELVLRFGWTGGSVAKPVDGI